MIRERGGSDEMVMRAMAIFAEAPAIVDIVLWSMLGAIMNIYHRLGFPKHKIEARRSPV